VQNQEHLVTFNFIYFETKVYPNKIEFNFQLTILCPNSIKINYSVKTIVCRPGPRPGYRVLTGSPDRPGQFLKKIKMTSSKQKSTGCNRVFNRVLLGRRVTPGFFFLFFLQPGPVSDPDRSGCGSTRWVGLDFKTMVKTQIIFCLSNHTVPWPNPTMDILFFTLVQLQARPIVHNQLLTVTDLSPITSAKLIWLFLKNVQIKLRKTKSFGVFEPYTYILATVTHYCRGL